MHCALPLGLIPSVCIYLGVTWFGWRLGAGEEIVLPAAALAVSVAYFFALLGGYTMATLLLHYLCRTYEMQAPIGKCCAFIATVGAPLAVGGVMHLFPSAPLNTDEQIARAAQQLAAKTEMDALVAYLQSLRYRGETE